MTTPRRPTRKSVEEVQQMLPDKAHEYRVQVGASERLQSRGPSQLVELTKFKRRYVAVAEATHYVFFI